MPRTEYIEEAWRKCAVKMFAPGASPDERDKGRHLFYGGASWMLLWLTDTSKEAQVTTEEALKKLDDVKREIELYRDEMMKRKEKHEHPYVRIGRK